VIFELRKGGIVSISNHEIKIVKQVQLDVRKMAGLFRSSSLNIAEHVGEFKKTNILIAITRKRLRYLIYSIFALAAIAMGAPAYAVPSFAQQTSQPCQMCHVGGLGPQLTPFGRNFKLHGYTMRTQKSVPLAAMAIASSTSTAEPQAAPPEPGFETNNNLALDQVSVFLAAGVGDHVGGFIQATYDGVTKATAWDNVDLRLINTGKVGDMDLVYGLSVNNSPGVQDSWNTTAAWGFPYTDSALAPGPAAAPLLSGGLAQEVIGVTAYAWLDSKFYLEAGGYTTPSASTLNWLGADPNAPGDIKGLAPYGRVAVQLPLAGGTFEAGGFALKAAIRPERDRTTGLTDDYTDFGLDASWYKALDSSSVITANTRYTHEKQSLNATCTLGFQGGEIPVVPLADCADTSLNEWRADASFYWRNKVGLTLGAFDIWGAENPSLYASNRTFSPDSSGYIVQIDGTLFGGTNAPFGRLNLRIGAQYTGYTKFDGARHDYDGTGRNASDNNTFRIFTWLAF
jgi:hypothetical protein